MRNLSAIRWIVAAAVLTAMLASVVSFRADAQSEYMRGDRMPYDAFDRLPRTDLEIGGGTIHVGFAPGEMTLPASRRANARSTGASVLIPVSSTNSFRQPLPRMPSAISCTTGSNVALERLLLPA